MYRRKAVVTAVSTTANASAMTCVQFTNAPNRVNVWLELGSGRKRANAPPTGARQAISPSRMSASPSVPIILTSGSRAAKAGPKSSP